MGPEPLVLGLALIIMLGTIREVIGVFSAQRRSVIETLILEQVQTHRKIEEQQAKMEKMKRRHEDLNSQILTLYDVIQGLLLSTSLESPLTTDTPMKRVLSQYVDNLVRLQAQIAAAGGPDKAPISLLNQLEATRAMIRKIEHTLDIAVTQDMET